CTLGPNTPTNLDGPLLAGVYPTPAIYCEELCRLDFRFRGRSGHHSAIVYQSRFMSTRLNQSPKPSRTELSHSRIGRASRSFQKRRWQVVAQFDCNKPFARAWALSARRT